MKKYIVNLDYVFDLCKQVRDTFEEDSNIWNQIDRILSEIEQRKGENI